MNKRKEKISAFLDNDLHRDELMSFSLSAESDDAKIAQRYQMMGEALRGEMSDSSFIDVSYAVREALAAENIVDDSIAVEGLSQQTSGLNNKSESGRSVLSAWDLSAWFRPAAGMAFAVLVAVAMVLTVSEQESDDFTPVAVNIDENSAVKSTTVANDNSLQRTQPYNANNVVTSHKATAHDPRVDKRLVNQRLVDQHLEFATQDALQGRLPYVRAVSFKADK